MGGARLFEAVDGGVVTGWEEVFFCLVGGGGGLVGEAVVGEGMGGSGG